MRRSIVVIACTCAAAALVGRASISATGAGTSPALTTVAITPTLVIGGTTYVAAGGTVDAFNTITGHLKWSQSTCDGSVATPLAIAGGRVWVGDAGGEVEGINVLTGRIDGCQDIGYSYFSGLTAANGVVYAGNSGGQLVAISATTMSVLWSVYLGSKNLQTPSYAGGYLYVASASGLVYKVNPVSGKVVLVMHT